MKRQCFGKERDGYKYENSFKRHVVAEYLQGDLSLAAIGRKYGLDRRQVHEWKTQYYGELVLSIKADSMTEQEQKDLEVLKAQYELLKRALEDEQMRTYALESLIDVAEQELKIDIRKKRGAKQQGG
jgi:transposase